MEYTEEEIMDRLVTITKGNDTIGLAIEGKVHFDYTCDTPDTPIITIDQRCSLQEAYTIERVLRMNTEHARKWEAALKPIGNVKSSFVRGDIIINPYWVNGNK